MVGGTTVRRVFGGLLVAALLCSGCTSDDTAGGDDPAGTDSAGGPREDQTPPEGVSMEGTGPSPEGAGLFSEAAMAQETCNDNGHTTFNTVGGGPFCVNPWPEGGDNGGATATGVTATEVKVVLYVPTLQMAKDAGAEQLAADLATGEEAPLSDVLADWEDLYDYAVDELGTYQLWGRRPVFELVEASGIDEAAQRADAQDVISREPFIVVDLVGVPFGGSPTFSAAVAAKKIVVASPSTTGTIGAEQSPYRWNFASDDEAGLSLTAAFIGRTLADEPATWAGDPQLASETRAFGVVHPSDFDIDLFESLVDENGGPPIAQAIEFDPDAQATFGEQVPTMVNRLKASGVTSVVVFGDNTLVGPLTEAATDQDYHPEWITTAFGYQELDLFGRGYDPEQWKHAFGLSVLFPNYPKDVEHDYLDLFTWYWGPENGSNGAFMSSIDWVYQAMNYAGPNLNADNLKMGLFSAPASGGAASDAVGFQTGFGDSVGMPYPEYATLGTDRSLVWWDPEITTRSQLAYVEGVGGFRYIDGGRRLSFSDMPDDLPAFFDEEDPTAVSEIPFGDQFAGGEIPASGPCADCPSKRAGT